jgi:hypothetical protein
MSSYTVNFDALGYRPLDDKLFKLLAHYLRTGARVKQTTTRLACHLVTECKALKRETLQYCQKSLSTALSLSRWTVARNLKCLEELGLITIKKDTKQIEYHFDKMCELIALDGIVEKHNVANCNTNVANCYTFNNNIYNKLKHSEAVNEDSSTASVAVATTEQKRDEVKESTTVSVKKANTKIDLATLTLDEETAEVIKKQLNRDIATADIEAIVQKTAKSDRWRCRFAVKKDVMIRWITQILATHFSSESFKKKDDSKSKEYTAEQLEAKKTYDQEVKQKLETWDQHEITQKLKKYLVSCITEPYFQAWCTTKQAEDFKFDASTNTVSFTTTGIKAGWIKSNCHRYIREFCEKYSMKFNVFYYDSYYAETKKLSMHEVYL